MLNLSKYLMVNLNLDHPFCICIREYFYLNSNPDCNVAKECHLDSIRLHIRSVSIPMLLVMASCTLATAAMMCILYTARPFLVARSFIWWLLVLSQARARGSFPFNSFIS